MGIAEILIKMRLRTLFVVEEHMSHYQFCPHCGQQTALGAFCESCGKALAGEQAGPRIVDTSSATGIGLKLKAQELEKQAKSAATALLITAILGVIGLFFLAVLFQQAENNPNEVVDWSVAKAMLIGQSLFCLTFFGLWIWARSSPLPAAIVGMVIFVSIHVVTAVIDPATIIQGIIFKIIILYMLCKAIGGGLKHRELMRAHALGT